MNTHAHGGQDATIRKAGPITSTLCQIENEHAGIGAAVDRLAKVFNLLQVQPPQAVEVAHNAPRPTPMALEHRLNEMLGRTQDLSAALHALAERFEAALE